MEEMIQEEVMVKEEKEVVEDVTKEEEEEEEDVKQDRATLTRGVCGPILGSSSSSTRRLS